MKMTKIIASLSVIGFVGMVPQAGAVELTGSVTTAACNILGENVNISISKNTGAGYTCLASDASKTPAIIAQVAAGTCNSGGNAKARMVTCTRQVSGDAVAGFTYTNMVPTTCGDGNFEAGKGVGKTGAAGQVQVTGLTFYSATTAGGSVGTSGLEAKCDNAAMSAVIESIYGVTTAK